MTQSTEHRGPVRQTWALFRFLLGSGARVALRANGIVGATVVFVYALDINAVAKLRVAILQVVARSAPSDARMALAVLCVALARLAVPRVTLGTAGWMRSLPVAAAATRRAAVAALTAVQVFPIAFVAFGSLAAVFAYHARLDPAKLASVPLILVSASMLALPVESFASREIAGLALVLALPGRWPLSAGALAALILADRMAGDIARMPRKHARVASRLLTSRSASLRWAQFTRHTLPIATMASSLLLPALFTTFTVLIVVRNPDIDAAMVGRTARLGGMFAVISLVASLATTITRRRPVWSWARSLPWSSRERVFGDAALLAVPAIPIVVVLALLDWSSALVVAGVVPALAIAAASAIRVGARYQASAAGETIAYGTIMGAAIGLWPWTSALALAATPFLFAHAARRDRRVIASRFEELHHDAAGDPTWTSAS